MDFMTIILAVVAVYVAKPAFLGKGKLMAMENVKEGKEKTARKGLRIAYLVMFFCSLLMILVTVCQNKGFTANTYKVTFDDAYTDASGNTYEAGQQIVLDVEGMNALYALPADAQPTPQPANNGLSCAPAASSYAQVPCKYEAIKELTELGQKIPGKDIDAKYKFIRTMSIVFFIISLCDIVFLLVFINKMTDKDKKAKAQATQTAAANHRVSMPSGAFTFDENEPVAPDDPKVADAGKL